MNRLWCVLHVLIMCVCMLGRKQLQQHTISSAGRSETRGTGGGGAEL